MTTTELIDVTLIRCVQYEPERTGPWACGDFAAGLLPGTTEPRCGQHGGIPLRGVKP